MTVIACSQSYRFFSNLCFLFNTVVVLTIIKQYRKSTSKLIACSFHYIQERKNLIRFLFSHKKLLLIVIEYCLHANMSQNRSIELNVFFFSNNVYCQIDRQDGGNKTYTNDIT